MNRTQSRSTMLLSMGALLLASAVAHAQGKPVAIPCADDPVFQQQDFTLGHWDVYAGEQKTAEVRMERALNGCAIHETWTPVEGRPGSGLGLFTYSRLLKSWGYFWVADTAQTTAFTGSLESKGNMRYVTEAPLPDGGKRLRHW